MDKEGVPGMAQDWTTDEMADLTAEELSRALNRLGIGHHDCYVAGDGDISIAFHDIRDAEAMVSLGVLAVHEAGTLYDRASASCVSLTALGGSDSTTSEDVRDALDKGWTWTIHPHMRMRRMDWHVSVDIPVMDAYQLTSNLNRVAMVEL